MLHFRQPGWITIGLAVMSIVSASPIETTFGAFPAGTVIYHASGVTLESISAKTFDKQAGEDRITVNFLGEWQINPELKGVDIKPQAGIVIGADTAERKRKLQELRSHSSPLRGKKVDIFIYGGAVNKDRATYAYPEQIKIVSAGSKS